MMKFLYLDSNKTCVGSVNKDRFRSFEKKITSESTTQIFNKSSSWKKIVEMLWKEEQIDVKGRTITIFY